MTCSEFHKTIMSKTIPSKIKLIIIMKIMPASSLKMEAKPRRSQLVQPVVERNLEGRCQGVFVMRI